MTQYNTFNVKFSNFQLNESKLGIKSRNEVTVNLTSNVIDSSNDEANFSNKLLLANAQVSRLCKAFVNNG